MKIDKDLANYLHAFFKIRSKLKKKTDDDNLLTLEAKVPWQAHLSPGPSVMAVA